MSDQKNQTVYRVLPPTFDEWYAAKFGGRFEDDHMRLGERYDDAFRALARLMRDYISDVARR